jgi:cytoskeletal protein RodZ
MTPQELFINRLRRHRQRIGISLEEIGRDTRVKPELLAAFEENDLSEWPRGLYARAWIRAYASAIGLDPIDTVDEFCRLFPHGDRRAKRTFREMSAIVSETSEYRDEFAHPEDRRRRNAPEVAVTPTAAWHTPIGQGARALWLRITTLAGMHLRPRRAPRTSH